MTIDPSKRLAVARVAAEAGGERALQDFRREIDVETKENPIDFVTEADRAAQRAVVSEIRDGYPDDPIVGEEDETPSELPESGPAWIVDPIDGTTNFVRGMPTWTTVVAAIEDGEPVASVIAAPALGDVYAAGGNGATKNGDSISVSGTTVAAESIVCPTLWLPRDRRDEFAAIVGTILHSFGDTRRIGSAQLELALVADGGLDATIASVRGDPWDTVAGSHVVRQAGGRVTNLEGDRWRHDSRGIVASNGEIHEKARDAALAGDRARE